MKHTVVTGQLYHRALTATRTRGCRTGGENLWRDHRRCGRPAPQTARIGPPAPTVIKSAPSRPIPVPVSAPKYDPVVAKQVAQSIKNDVRSVANVAGWALNPPQFSGISESIRDAAPFVAIGICSYATAGVCFAAMAIASYVPVYYFGIDALQIVGSGINSLMRSRPNTPASDDHLPYESAQLRGQSVNQDNGQFPLPNNLKGNSVGGTTQNNTYVWLWCINRKVGAIYRSKVIGYATL